MISYFPELYPDELAYSLLARFYVQSGYLSYIYAAEDIYNSKTVRPDPEFLNPLRDEVKNHIVKKISMEKLIEYHTMYPYYGRFLGKYRRQIAFKEMVSMGTQYRNYLAIPTNKEKAKRFLRYCPICAKEDRNQYGETFWHRSHQLLEVNVCYKHRCLLQNTPVVISGKSSPNLVAAENVVSVEENVIPCTNSIEIQLAEYVTNVFHSPVDMESDVPVGKFIHSRITGTEYVSVRGEQRNITLLYEDFMKYYSSLPKQGLSEIWQIQKVFTEYRYNTYEICQLAMFLNIPVTDLVHMSLPQKSQKEIFDEKVRKLRRKGMKYPEIAKVMGASYDVVKPIGEQRYGIYEKKTQNSKKCGAKPLDWNRMDAELLPAVKEAIKEIYGDGTHRPHKVTVYAVCRYMNLPDKKFEKLPICKAEILKYHESQEQYWAREVVWAVCQLQKDGIELCWKRIRDRTNMRKENFIACLPYIDEIEDEELAYQIRSLV